MLSKKSLRLKEIIGSKGGLHLTAYLPSCEDGAARKKQIREIALSALSQLDPRLNREERNRFLRPLIEMMADQNFMDRLPKSSLALFRNKGMFRILTMPLPVERLCVVANSFHVKPLLEWIQSDREFLLLGVREGGAVISWGSQQAYRELGAFHAEPSSHLPRCSHEVFEWLNSELRENVLGPIPRLYLAGEWGLIQPLRDKMKGWDVSCELAGTPFDTDRVSQLCKRICEREQWAARAILANSFLEFEMAEKRKYATKNLFEIGLAAAKGRVRKLIVAAGVEIFGRVDERTGAMAIQKFDREHVDDILDDLAQLVISQGGQVLVAPFKEIPRGRHALAILNKSESSPSGYHAVKKHDFGAVRAAAKEKGTIYAAGL